MQIRPLRRRWDGHGLAFMFEGEGIPTAHKSCVAKLESSYLASINTKLDNCSSGKKKKVSVILSKGNKTSWHTVLFVETAPGCMPQSVSHVEGGPGKTYVAFYSLMQLVEQ